MVSISTCRSARRRATPGPRLSKNGVAPRTAQAAMRHSSLDLTMLARRGENVYTHPSLLDVAGALEVLPELCLSTGAGRAKCATAAAAPTGPHGQAGKGREREVEGNGARRGAGHRPLHPFLVGAHQSIPRKWLAVGSVSSSPPDCSPSSVPKRHCLPLAREAQCLDECRDQMVTHVDMGAENQGYGPGGARVEPSTAYHEDHQAT